MQSASEFENPKELHSLAELHPDYTPMELEEAKDSLTRHFEMAWKMFLRLEGAGESMHINLTASEVSPTLSPQRSIPPDSSNKIA